MGKEFFIIFDNHSIFSLFLLNFFIIKFTKILDWAKNQKNNWTDSGKNVFVLKTIKILLKC